MDSIQQAPQSFKSRCFTTSILGIYFPPFTTIYYPFFIHFLYFFRIWVHILKGVPPFDNFCIFFGYTIQLERRNTMQDGMLISKLRSEHNLSQKDMARFLKVTLSSYKLYEANIRPMRIE